MMTKQPSCQIQNGDVSDFWWRGTKRRKRRYSNMGTFSNPGTAPFFLQADEGKNGTVPVAVKKLETSRFFDGRKVQDVLRVLR